MKLVLVDDSTDEPTVVAITALTDRDCESIALEAERAVLAGLQEFALGRLVEIEMRLNDRRSGDDPQVE